MIMKSVNVNEFVKNYKFQVAACAASVVLAVLAAVVGHAVSGETARTALRVYFVIHPAVVVAAIPLETLAVVALLMETDDPGAFLESAATTSSICVALCAAVALTAGRKVGLMAAVTLPYCALSAAVCVAAFLIHKRRSRG